MSPFARSRVLALSWIVLTGTFLIVSPFSSGDDKARNPDGKTIFNDRCLKCHKVEKFRALQYDQKGWEIVLSRMERNKACNLSDDERTAVSEYLAKQFGE
jgi:mono/diheme cytochrome c family protein